MPARKDTFAARIRKACILLRHDTMTYADISSTADLRSSAEEVKMRYTIADFVKSGEMVRIAPGVLRYVGKDDSGKITEKRRVMWRILKMRRTVTVEEMQEMAGASNKYALEWLSNLRRIGVVEKIPGKPASKPSKWRLVKDIAHMPADEEQAAKYREIRRQKKAVLGQVLDDIQAGINRARTVLEDDI
ncbi:MAG: hypothetical protein C0613_08465 [Desulfobulbaceae bacterium]|nr:MAG: hypothetical protein C0613_08465 [Desulfobulbaceae bacterium]